MLIAIRPPSQLRQLYLGLASGMSLLGAQACEYEGADEAPPCVIGPVPAELQLDPAYYEKYCEADGGLPVLGSGAVSEDALVEAARLVARVLGDRPHLREGIVAAGGRVTIMSELERLTEVPEFRGESWPDSQRDPESLRGLGGAPDRPVTVGAEENVLCWATDPYNGRYNVLLHELAHTIHLVGIGPELRREGSDDTFQLELEAAYTAAMDAGLWADTYAATDVWEYWAEAVGIYFGDVAGIGSGGAVGVTSRAALREYDPALFALLHWAFGDDDWHPQCPTRPRAEAAGRRCSAPYSGEDVWSISLPEADRGSVSGTIHLPHPAERETSGFLHVRGQTDDAQALSYFNSQWVATGTETLRYSLGGIPPGDYLFSFMLDQTGADDHEIETSWFGTHNAERQGVGKDVVHVGPEARCGVDIRVYEPDESDSEMARIVAPRVATKTGSPRVSHPFVAVDCPRMRQRQ